MSMHQEDLTFIPTDNSAELPIRQEIETPKGVLYGIEVRIGSGVGDLLL